MTETERIADQLKRAFEGEAWHGPSVLESLDGVTPEMAALKPVPGAHSIWELALHIFSWERVGLRRLRGDRAQIYQTEEDWPLPTGGGEAEWARVLERLTSNHNELMAEIARLDEERLDQPIFQDMASVYVTLHGMIQHDIYHAGQIAVIKKACLAMKG